MRSNLFGQPSVALSSAQAAAFFNGQPLAFGDSTIAAIGS
jgi:hypothetical protein